MNSIPDKPGYWWARNIDGIIPAADPSEWQVVRVLKFVRNELWFIAPGWSAFLPIKMARSLEIEWGGPIAPPDNW